MSLLHFSAACLVVLLVTHYAVLPWLRRSVRSRPTPVSLATVAWIAVVRYVRGVALAAVVTSILVAGVVALLRWRASPLVQVAAIQAALGREHALKQRLDAAHPYWFGTAAILMTSALGYYTYRRRRIQCSAAFSAAHDAEIQRLVDAMNNDRTWWDLAPTDEMLRVYHRMNAIRDQLPGLPDQARPEAEQAIEQLRRYLIQLDIVRRMEFNADPDAIEDPEPETWRDWAAGLAGSPRVAGATRSGTRLLYRFNALLLVVGLIGFQSVGIKGVIQDRIVALDDLAVRLDNLKQVEQEVALAVADRAEEEAERDQESQSSSSTSSTRVLTPSSRLAAQTVELKAKAAQAMASQPSYDDEEAVIKRVSAEADDLAAEAKSLDDVADEIRRAADDLDVQRTAKTSDARPRPRSGPDDAAPRLANLRERLNKAASKLAPDHFVKPKADAVNERLAAFDPETELRNIDGQAAAGEQQAAELKAAVDARPAALDQKLKRVGDLDGWADDIALLKKKVDLLRSDTGARYSSAAQELKTLRERIAAERYQRVSDITPRRTRAVELAARANRIDGAQRLLPGKVDQARTLLTAADSKAEWDLSRPLVGDGAVRPLVSQDAELADVLARTYEEALGRSAPLRGAAPAPDPATGARLRALATRDAILDHASKVAPTERIRPPSLSDAPGLSAGQRGVAQSAQSIFRNDAPRTLAGKAMREEILAEMRLSPRFRQTVIAEAPAARARLLGDWGTRARSVPGQRFWSELTLTTFDAAVERVAGPEVADALGEISRATLSNYEAARRYQFLRDLAGGRGGLQSALDRVAAGAEKVTLPETGRDYFRQVSARVGSAGDAVRAVAPYEPAIEVPFERGVNLERAGSIVMEQTAHGDAATRNYRVRAFSEALENYSGTFPSQPGIERVTPRGQLLETIASEHATTAKGAEAALKGRVASIEAGKLSEWTAGRKFSTTATLVKNGRIELPRTPLPSTAVNSVERARSFLRLHSSPRVGGVLIGRKPEAAAPGAAPLRPAALRWEIGAADVRLNLVGPDGTERRSRPFRRDLTELALAYAADGRPTAVTVVNLSPLLDRKVLLHPALVDTAAGKMITRTDMIIFQLIEDKPWYVDAYIGVLNQVELYRRAWAIRQLVLGPLGVLNPEYVAEVERHLKEGATAVRAADPQAPAEADERRSALAFLSAATNRDGVVAELTRTARDLDAITDPARSPLTVKTAYFDPELVADMLAAGGPGRSLDDFDSALRRSALRRLGDLGDWFSSYDLRERTLVARVETFKARTATPAASREEYNALVQEQTQLKADAERFEAQSKEYRARLDPLLRRWTAPVPKLAHVSGIRERPFTLTETECFVAEGKEMPAVLDFLIQITYDTPPYFLKGVPPPSEDKAAWEALTAYADDAPWEFPEISARVREVVRKALAEDPEMAEDRGAVATLAEFTILQRLFRAALTGELGPDFPVESLALLHREAAPSAPPAAVRTPRWESRPGILELSLKQLADRELAAAEAPGRPDALQAWLVEALRRVASAADEYATKIADRDQALGAVEQGPEWSGLPCPAWEAAWDSFQSWAVGWEERLGRLSADIESRANIRLLDATDEPARTRPAITAVQDAAGKDDPRVKEKTEQIVGMVRWTSSAIALRRALDVAADDKLARAAKHRPGATRFTAAASPAP
jgi:hypothetical protein